jgi:uncharacterized protein (DUF983 family)
MSTSHAANFAVSSNRPSGQAALVEVAADWSTMTHEPASKSPVAAGLKGRCPRCGHGALFRSGLVLRDRCTSCGLDYKFIDTGDGPAVFAIFILGFVVLGSALIAEFKFGVPVWFHVVAWGLLTPVLALAVLRTLKGVLIAQQFKHKAEEGRLG